MTIEEAIKTFRVLADEEQDHLDYLESKLSEWNKTERFN